MKSNSIFFQKKQFVIKSFLFTVIYFLSSPLQDKTLAITSPNFRRKQFFNYTNF